MEEHEYSFEVRSAAPYHQFCQQKAHSQANIMTLHRRIFKDGSFMIARLTSETDEDQSTVSYIDFKENSDDDQLAKTVQETRPVSVESIAEQLAPDLLKSMGFKLSVTLVKKRTRYDFGDFHVDIDEYSQPRRAAVVEIEGPKEQVKTFYQTIQAEISQD